MRFGEDHKVIIDSLEENEARSFIKFLESEIIRHRIDIQQAIELIEVVQRKFDIKD